MFFVFLQLDLLAEVIQDAIHTHAGKALLSCILKHLDMFAFFASNDGRQHNKARTFSQCFNTVDDLIDGLPGNLLAAFGAVRHTDPGPQKAQIVINLRNRAYSRTWILGGGLLVNGDGRTQSFNGIHIRLVHLAQKLTGIRAQTFHIPALTFGIDRIKGQAGLAGTGKAGKYHQFVSWDGKIDIF